MRPEYQMSQATLKQLLHRNGAAYVTSPSAWLCQNARAGRTRRTPFLVRPPCPPELWQARSETAAPVKYDSPPWAPFRSFYTDRVNKSHPGRPSARQIYLA